MTLHRAGRRWMSHLLETAAGHIPDRGNTRAACTCRRGGLRGLPLLRRLRWEEERFCSAKQSMQVMESQSLSLKKQVSWQLSPHCNPQTRKPNNEDNGTTQHRSEI